MPKDYYIVLGISRNANLDKIKKAYRKTVKKVHPDITHSRHSKSFREIQEAYDTLSDIDKRRIYDSELKRRGIPVDIKSEAEPITPRDTTLGGTGSWHSRADEFLEGILPGFFEKERYTGIQKDLYLEVILTPSEAMRGGMFPVQVPVMEKCPNCAHGDFFDLFICQVCLGRGHIQSEREFSVSIPPGVRHGLLAKVSLEDIGLYDVELNIRVLIDIPAPRH
jgi:DnaJ-class molecular chaperone